MTMNYLARCRECHGMTMAAADTERNRKEAALAVYQAILDGDIVTRALDEAIRQTPLCTCGFKIREDVG